MSIELDKKKEIQNKKEGKVKNTTKNIKEITDKIISKSKLHQFLTEKELKASDKQRIDTIKKRVEKSGKKWKEFEEDIKELHKLFEDNRVVDNNIGDIFNIALGGDHIVTQYYEITYRKGNNLDLPISELEESCIDGGIGIEESRSKIQKIGNFLSQVTGETAGDLSPYFSNDPEDKKRIQKKEIEPSLIKERKNLAKISTPIEENINGISISKFNISFMGLLNAGKLHINSAKKIFKRVSKVIEGLATKEAFDIIPPELSDIIRFRERNNAEGSVSDEKFMGILEWNISKFNEEDMENIFHIAKQLYEELSQNHVNLNFQPFQTKNNPFKNGKLESMDINPQESSFKEIEKEEKAGIFLIKGKNSETKQRLRLAFDDLNVVEITALSMQIGNYIQKKEFIKKPQLYFYIYQKLLEADTKSEKLYDISIFEKQYEKVLEDLIIPLCLPELNIKPKSMLLTGIYGGGKSQTLKHIIHNNAYTINGKQYPLKANKIVLSTMELHQLLSGDAEHISHYIKEIYKHTGLLTLIFVEDIDTIIRAADENDFVGQALTVFLEGIGQAPCKIIATTNYPERINSRHLRPNRFHSIVDFHLPSEEERREIIKEHIKESLPEHRKKQKLVEQLISLSKDWTAAHIGGFIQEVKKKLTITQNVYEEKDINIYKIIQQCTESFILNKEDIKESEKKHEEWLKRIKDMKQPMGFINEKNN